jgi:hypothetical protein
VRQKAFKKLEIEALLKKKISTTNIQRKDDFRFVEDEVKWFPSMKNQSKR